MQKLVERIFWITLLLVAVGSGTAYAVRVSGPGQNTKVNSLSVAVASDQVLDTTSAQNVLTAITPSDSTDTSSYCNGYIYVGGTGDAGLALVGTGTTIVINDAGVTDSGVTLSGVTAGTKLDLKAQRIKSAGTSVTGIVCVGH